MRLLWLTNDLPPRAGGAQQFHHDLASRLDPGEAVVVAPHDDDAPRFDPTAPYRIVRGEVSKLRPDGATLDLVRRAVADHPPDVVVIGGSWPLGGLAGRLRSALGAPVVAITHGLEAGFARVGLGRLVRRATRDCAAVTTITDYTQRVLAPHVGDRLVRLPPGVDVDTFRPGLDGNAARRRWGIPSGAPVVGCVGRLVARKGQDVLLDAWPSVRRAHPHAWLAIAGDGPRRASLARAVGRLGPRPQVVLTGRLWPEDLPGAYAAMDVFAMPCRTRLAGADVEGLGMVYLEAQACGIPVVAGRSGGAPEAVKGAETGYVVDGGSTAEVAGVLIGLLGDPILRARLGAAGRAWVEREWAWDGIAGRFRTILEGLRS